MSAFIFANLIIAVICDGVRAMEDGECAGLTGYEEDEIYRHRVVDGLGRRPESPCIQSQTTTMQKLREMEQQLDQIVIMQNQLRVAMEIISRSPHLTRSTEANGSATDENGSFVALNELFLTSFPEAVISEEDRDSEESVSAQQSTLDVSVTSSERLRIRNLQIDDKDKYSA